MLIVHAGSDIPNFPVKFVFITFLRNLNINVGTYAAAMKPADSADNSCWGSIFSGHIDLSAWVNLRPDGIDSSDFITQFHDLAYIE